MFTRGQGLGPSASDALAPEVAAVGGQGHCEERMGSQVPAGTPCSLEPRGVEVHRSLGSQLLPFVSVLLKFRVHDFECGQEIAKEEDEESERQHEHLGRERGVGGRQAKVWQGGKGNEEKAPQISSLLRCPPCPCDLLSVSPLKTAVFHQQTAEIWAN